MAVVEPRPLVTILCEVVMTQLFSVTVRYPQLLAHGDWRLTLQ